MTKTKDKFKKKVLPNGLTVLTYNIDGLMSTHVSLMIRSGAIHENTDQLGLAHFTEHSVMLGTKKHKNHEEISKFILQNGASFNGRVNRFLTEYWINLPSKHLDKGVEFVYNYAFGSLLKSNEIEKEKKVILQEYEDFIHNPTDLFYHKAWQKRFKNEDHPYTRKALGVPKTIQSFSTKQVKEWIDKYYSPSNMVLSVAGKVNSDLLDSSLESTFGKQGKGNKISEPVFKKDFSGYTLYHHADKRPQISFYLTIPIPGNLDISRTQKMAYRHFNLILGSGSTSRLFHRIREKEKLVYGVHSNLNFHSYMGALQIWGSTQKDNLVKAISHIKEELDRVKKDGVTAEEFKLARDFMDAKTYMSYDNPSSIVSSFINQIYDYDDMWFPEDYEREGKKIKIGDINEIAKKTVDYSNINISLLGTLDKEDLKKVDKIFRAPSTS